MQGCGAAGFPLNRAVGMLQVDDPYGTGWAAVSVNPRHAAVWSRTLSLLKGSETFSTEVTPRYSRGPCTV